MGFPTFTTGDVLTAADMNAVGLWLVKTQTIGTAVSSVTVTDAFSSTYDNYVIHLSGGTASAGASLRLQLGSATTAYYAGYVQVTLATGVVAGTADNNAALFSTVGVTDTDGLSMSVTVLGPNLAKHTWIHGMAQVGNAVTRTFSGKQSSTTQFTAFTISPNTGTLTGGTIRVYGYRN